MILKIKKLKSKDNNSHFKNVKFQIEIFPENINPYIS